ncbi:MAG TPA: DUF6152 family protein [Steroidobacteraceae bacterium]|nr:DUF6152 family protein [Steroidobacteraceae bacterium]
MRRMFILSVAISALIGANSVSAHHSFAMYDSTRQITLVGVVKELQWTNPHVWIEVLVPNATGGQDEWGVECTSVNFMTRRGFTKHTIKSGDKISVTISPLKDGSHGGSFKSINSLNDAPLILEPQD